MFLSSSAETFFPTPRRASEADSVSSRDESSDGTAFGIILEADAHQTPQNKVLPKDDVEDGTALKGGTDEQRTLAASDGTVRAQSEREDSVANVGRTTLTEPVDTPSPAIAALDTKRLPDSAILNRAQGQSTSLLTPLGGAHAARDPGGLITHGGDNLKSLSSSNGENARKLPVNERPGLSQTGDLAASAKSEGAAVHRLAEWPVAQSLGHLRVAGTEQSMVGAMDQQLTANARILSALAGSAAGSAAADGLTGKSSIVAAMGTDAMPMVDGNDAGQLPLVERKSVGNVPAESARTETSIDRASSITSTASSSLVAPKNEVSNDILTSNGSTHAMTAYFDGPSAASELSSGSEGDSVELPTAAAAADRQTITGAATLMAPASGNLVPLAHGMMVAAAREAESRATIESVFERGALDVAPTSTGSEIRTSTSASPMPVSASGQTATAQLAQAFAAAPSGRTELRLDPEELGRVTLSMVSDERSITLVVMADRLETLDLLRRHIDALAQDFRDLGFEDISFQFGSEDTPPDEQEVGKDSAGAVGEADVQTQASSPAAKASSHGQLDIRL